MNFLAHLYLADNDDDSIIGNFIADHVKGNSINLFGDTIKRGIRFHRMIDEYTDRNDIVMETVVNLRPHYRKYAGVVLDMYYDHFLGTQWARYSNEPLPDFTHRIYSVLTSHMSILPKRSQYILPYMIEGNWLLNYRHFDGLHRALSGIASRTKFNPGLESSVEHLKDNYEFYRSSFNEFFPQLIKYSKSENYEY